MNENKHTPGPWKLIKHTMSTNHITIQAPDKRGNLKPVANMTIHHGDKKLDNARLIAAAPDLLEACKDVVKSFEKDTSLDMIKLQATIAQAETES